MPNDNSALPPGWQAKVDPNTGRTYYINHIDKISTWDHPLKGKKTPSKTFKQSNGTSKHNTTGEHIPMQEFSTRPRTSPMSKSKIHDSTLINTVDTEEAVSKIRAMFPTVSEPHIRLLMKNCRYMKSIFPQADETIILDVLYNNDNNVQKTSTMLRSMGFEKKDSLKMSQQKNQAKAKVEEPKTTVVKSTVVTPKVKSTAEKAKVKDMLQKEHKEVGEHLITMALESVEYDKEKASNLLKSMVQDTKTRETKVAEISTTDNKTAVQEELTVLPSSISKQSLKSLLKQDKCEKETISSNRIISETDSGYKSLYLSNTKGANPHLTKGNNEKLLLEDYVKWAGPNPKLRNGPKSGLANGPNPSLKLKKEVLACGPNVNCHKGSNKSLAKGSMFQQITSAVTVG